MFSQDPFESLLRDKVKKNYYNSQNSAPNLLDAAVLILLVKIDKDWSILYTLRTQSVKTHKGEVSFPGGAYETEDQTLERTALRETQEEIGVIPSDIEIIGDLESYQTVTGFFVHPYIGILKNTHKLVANKEEVDRIFFIPIAWLSDKQHYFEKDLKIDGNTIKKVIHYKEYDGEHLWGLTARMTLQVIDLLK